MIKWFLVNGLFAFVIYFGFIQDIEGAKNIALFYAWFCIFISFFYFTDNVQKIIKQKGRSVPMYLNVFFDISVCAVFVWFSAWITGVFYLIHLIIIEVAIQESLNVKSN